MTEQVFKLYGRADIFERAERMEKVLDKVKDAALKPASVKVPPRFTQALVGQILGLTKSQMLYRITEGKFVGGTRLANRTVYSVEDVRNFARADGRRHPHAEGHGICLAIANFKGGVGKSSTTVTLAQYLSLRGLNVAVIDLDPQASTTTLFGVSPYLDVNETNGAYGFFSEDGDIDVRSLARKTYWPGIDLFAANQRLYTREFALAAAAQDLAGGVFEYLQEKIAPLREIYDVIIIDTQPSLGFLTTNAIYAADHLVVTVPPSNLDFASSVIFWSLLRDVMVDAENGRGNPKVWHSIAVLQTRVDEQDKSSEFVRKLLAMGCEDWLLPDIIPSTRVATTAASEFATVYDIERYEGSHRSIKRAREAFDKGYVQLLDSINRTWDFWAHPEKFRVEMNPVVDLPFSRAVPAGVDQEAAA